MYLSIFSNVLILCGYTIRKICSDNERACFADNLFIIFGHFTAMVAELTNFIEDLYYLAFHQHLPLNGYYAVANILSALGEYKDLKTSLFLKDCNS